jgi:uncharacterized protein (TIRG00374 family)
MTSWRAVLLWSLFLIVGIVLMVLTLGSVPFDEIASLLGALQAWQLGMLLLVNIGILFMFPWRWSDILRAQKQKVPYLFLARYRLTAFAISYFTPGQNYGGEPLQVLYLARKHKVPQAKAIASVSMDRVIELIANSLVLAALLMVVLIGRRETTDIPLWQALSLSFFLVLIPVGFLLLIWLGHKPIAWATGRFKGKLANSLRKTEKQLRDLMRQNPRLVARGLGIGALVWVALIFEIWLSVYFLGLQLGFVELAVVVVAGRIALFAPTPGALGALEASQVLAMRMLGYDPAYGFGLALLIRARDIFFGLSGFALGLVARRQKRSFFSLW